MDPHVDVDAVASRASRYWMEDGLVEILLGLLVSIPIGVFWAAIAIPKGPFTDLVSLGGVQALWLAVILALVWGFKKLKKRITFPRTGYVALPQPTTMSRISFWVMFIAFGVIFRLLVSAPFDRMAVPGSAVVFALALIVLGLQVKLSRIMWEGVLTLVVGAFLYLFTNLKGSKGVIDLLAMTGASMAVVGTLQLRRFLRANPRNQETEA